MSKRGTAKTASLEQDPKLISRLIRPRKPIIIDQAFTAGTNSFQYSFQSNTNSSSLTFQPHYAILQEVLYTPLALGNDIGSWKVWSSLTNDYIATVMVGAQANVSNPRITLNCPEHLQSIEFRLVPAQGQSTATLGYLSLLFEFCQEKNLSII